MNKYLISILIILAASAIGAALYSAMNNQNVPSIENNDTVSAPTRELPSSASADVPAAKPSATSTAQQIPAPIAGSPRSHEVAIQNFAFSEKSITIMKGDSIIWTNKDSASHTVTGDNNGPSSSTLKTNEMYSFTFNTAGTFTYHCAFHPSMKGTVLVE